MYPLYYGFDSTMIVLIPAILLTLFAQNRVQSNFNKYLRVPSQRRNKGAEVARKLLDQNGLYNVPVEVSSGRLSDHYDPSRKVVRLSQEVYGGDSIAAVSVAAHEVGHAIQDADGYIPLNFRTMIFPVARFGSSAAWPLMLIGLLIPNLAIFMNLGIILFSASVLFQIITLPVELNASSRALELLDNQGLIVDNERRGVKKVLNAAALTYIAAMATGIAQLLRLIMIRDRNNQR